MNESSEFSAFQIAAFPKEVILLCIRKREICKLNRKYVSQFSESLINKKYDTCSSGELSEFVKRGKYISQSLPSPSFVSFASLTCLTSLHSMHICVEIDGCLYERWKMEKYVLFVLCAAAAAFFSSHDPIDQLSI